MRIPLHTCLNIGIGLLLTGATFAQPTSAPDQAARRNWTKYEQYALTHEGDPQRGRQLLRDAKQTKCLTCHQIKGEGTEVGPDLSHIAGKFDRPHLIESLLEPSRQIVEDYRSSVLLLDSGQVVTGIVKQQDENTITLVDVEGKQRVIPRDSIQQQQISPDSLMPQGLVDPLTRAEFTDLIAYLETLRPDGKLKPGGSITGPVMLPSGFQIQAIATSLTGLTALETTADGRIFVCEQTGSLRVIKDGRLLEQPFLTLEVDSYWERGLIGVTVHPDFPSTPYVYVCYVAKEPYPILLKRTPYGLKPYGVDQYPSSLGPSSLLAKAGYIFAYQDVRGRWMSEGDFVQMRPHRPVKNSPGEIDESTDTWDTVDWLIHKVKGNNGRVGIAGISYPGFYTAAGIIDSHPAIKAASPQAPVNDWFVGDDWHHNGAFFLAHMFNWMSRNGRIRPQPTTDYRRATFEYGTSDGYEFFKRMKTLSEIDQKHLKGEVPFWRETMRHGTYDAFWKARNIRPHLKNIRPAVMTVGGWFDAENLFGALETYKSIEANNRQTFNMLVMGPWRHGGWASGDGASFGDIPFNSKTAEFYREKIELPFFEFHLKDQGKMDHPEAWVFETGTNQWRKYNNWPPEQAVRKSLYFCGEEQLRFDPPNDRDARDEYLSDPTKPVPYMNVTATGMKAEYMVADQRFASRRPDVLVYQTDILKEDLTVVGPIEVDLFVSTSGTDSDWIVKLIDVYPDDFPDPAKNPKQIRMGGYQQMVRGDVIRGKFRNSLEKAEPFQPNQPTRVRFRMPDTYHCFRPGHRIMIQVQSTWFPLVDCNPQSFVDIYHADRSDYRQATQRVFRSIDLPSRVEVLTLP